MAAGDISRVVRAPGRLVVDPLDDFAALASEFPYSGTQVGTVRLCSLVPIGLPPFRVSYEALGETGQILEGDNRWAFSCMIRAWDREAVEQFLSDGYAVGASTQHAVYSVPGTRVPGSASVARGVKLAYIPDDEIHVPGVLMYRAIPNWTESAEMAFRRGDELGIPITFECLRDDTGRILQVGRIADLSI